MMLGLSIVKLSLCLYQKCCTLTTALCQYLPLRIFLEALCQYMYLWPSGTVPKYTSIPQWHCAKVYLYTLVALCQSIPLYPSGTVPMYAYLSGIVPKYTSMAIFLLRFANTYLYDYFPVALWQYLLIHVCILIVLKVELVQLLLPSPLPLPRCGEGG